MRDVAEDVKGQRAVHRGLRRADVLRAAVAIVDAEGWDALTMRRLAAELDVKAPSLYVHVRNKEDLRTGVLDAVLDEIVLPPVTKRRRSSLVAGFAEYRRVLVLHPGAVAVVTERTQPSPAQVRLVARSIELLEGAGLSTAAAVSAHVTLVAYTLGFVLQEVARRPPSAPAPPAPEEAPAPIEGQEVFVRAITALGRTSVDQRFRAGLDLILDGLPVDLR
jgi:AcrR family transcriptional regulator